VLYYSLHWKGRQRTVVEKFYINFAFNPANNALSFCLDTTTPLACTAALYNSNVTTVASSSSYLFYGVAVDSNNNLYASNNNAEVYKYSLGNNSTIGVLFAPTTIPTPATYARPTGGSIASQIGVVYGLFVNRQSNDLYMSDIGAYYSGNSQTPMYNYRIQRWGLNGSVAGSTIAGSAGYGLNLNQIGDVRNIHIDVNGVLYVPDASYHRVMKWSVGAINGVVVAGAVSGTTGSSLSLLSGPRGVSTDHAGNVYVSDTGNHRVVQWAPDAKSGIVVAGGNGPGLHIAQLSSPTAIIVDEKRNLFIFDSGNQRIQQWSQGATYGMMIFDGSYNNAVSAGSWGMAMDRFGNLYVTDHGGKRVQMISIVNPSVCSGK
jgi:hypothetical protein